MYEAHYDDVTAASIVGACVDTSGMDALYAEACCGYDGCEHMSAFPYIVVLSFFSFFL